MSAMSLVVDEVALANACEKKTNDELYDLLKQEQAITAASLRRAAVYIGVLQVRGEDMRQLNESWFKYALAIAQRKTAVEVIMAFLGNTMLLEKVMQLPLEEQMQYAMQGGLRLVFRNKQGFFDKTLFKPEAIGMEEIQTAFAGKKIRTEPEQRAFIEAREAEKRKREDEQERLRELDRQREQARENARKRREQQTTAFDSPNDETKDTNKFVYKEIAFTPEEMRQLQERADILGKTVAQVVIAGLRAAKYLS